MINRRMIRAGAAVLAFTASAASAEDWKTKYPEITFAVIPAENGSGVTERFTPFVNYLSKELGIKVNLRVANDYAAVIEGQRAGNIMPRFKMNQMGVDPDAYFSKVIFTGSHENAVLALAQGTVHVAANWWNAEDDSNLTRMLAKNMVKSSDGTPLKKEDFRIIVKSDLIINSPYAYLSDLPDDMKAAIKKAFLDAPEKDKEAFKKLSDGKNLPWQPIANDDYNKTIELIKFVDNLRKKAS